jgi:NDP-sugar pyrophosphorylase family protein
MILAAGLGTRLRPITHEMPKPLVPILNRPVMVHIAELLAEHGFREVIANIHWFPELIQEQLGDGSTHGIELSYRKEEKLLGTAGGVRNVSDFLGDNFLIISGDALTDIDLEAMREAHRAHGGIATLAVKRVPDTSEYGVVVTDGEGRVQGFQEKPDPAEALTDRANCGIYMFRSEIFDYFPEPGTAKLAESNDPPGFTDWAMDVFPALLENDVPFYVHEIRGYWNDIGNLQELRQGNFDALAGKVKVHPGAPEVREGIRAGQGTDIGGTEIVPPVLIGHDCSLGEGVRIEGPAVIGDRCRLGDSVRLKESILLADVELDDDSSLSGALLTPAGEIKS